MTFDSFTFEKGLADFREHYNARKRSSDAEFDVLEEIISVLLRDFGGKEDTDLSRNLWHSFYVTETLQDILVSEDVPPSETKLGVITALLHDIGYLLVRDRFRVYEEFQKSEVRKAHMAEGARYAAQILPQLSPETSLTSTECRRVSDIIAVHDLPSVRQENGARGLPLDTDDILVYAHREADRLWMTSEMGFSSDLAHLKKKREEATPQDQFDHVLARYKEEKSLYPDDGGFKGETLFRTEEGYRVFREQAQKLIQRYGLNPQDI